MPPGSRPLAGSSRISSSGSLSRAVATASRCRMPSEYDRTSVVAAPGEPDLVEHLVDTVRRHPGGDRQQPQGLAAAEVAEEARTLHDGADAPGDLGEAVRHRPAEDPHPALVGADQPEQGAQGGGLAGAVVAEETVDLTRPTVRSSPSRATWIRPAAAGRTCAGLRPRSLQCPVRPAVPHPCRSLPLPTRSLTVRCARAWVGAARGCVVGWVRAYRPGLRRRWRRRPAPGR